MKKKLLKYLTYLNLSKSKVFQNVKPSPKPMIALAKRTLFKIPKDQREKKYTEDTVTVYVDCVYPSNYANNFFDLYLPKQSLANQPIIVWIHGGGFIGGDKSEEKEYATELAKLGYAVAVMNYALVPDTEYPAPLIQTSEFVQYLIKKVDSYPINQMNFFIAGDSAGAHIAAQFLLVQTNEQYRSLIGVKKIEQSFFIRGALLYCGPFDLPQIVQNHQLKSMQYIFHRIGWGYANDRDWLTSAHAQTTIITQYITNRFPPSYITDGNFFSFEEDGKTLAKCLVQCGVPVVTRFFDKRKIKTIHEYQFRLKSKAGKIAFKDTTAFLNKYRQL